MSADDIEKHFLFRMKNWSFYNTRGKLNSQVNKGLILFVIHIRRILTKVCFSFFTLDRIILVNKVLINT